MGEIAEASRASGVVVREVLGEEANVVVGKGGHALGVGDASAQTEREHVGGVEVPAGRSGEARPRRRVVEKDGPQVHGRNFDHGTWIEASATEDASLSVGWTCRGMEGRACNMSDRWRYTAEKRRTHLSKRRTRRLGGDRRSERDREKEREARAWSVPRWKLSMS